MAAKKATEHTRVGLTPTQATQRGLNARALLLKYTQVTNRLDPSIPTGLTADLVTVGAIVPAVQGAKDEAVQTTAEQATALEQGYNMLTAIRTSVARARPKANVSLAYAIGKPIKKDIVKSVVAGLQTVIKRATAQPTEAAAFGILAADVTALTAQVAAIKAADQLQEATRAAVPATTKERNATLRRILTAVDRIAGAGLIEFANSPTERALFHALIRKGA